MMQAATLCGEQLIEPRNLLCRVDADTVLEVEGSNEVARLAVKLTKNTQAMATDTHRGQRRWHVLNDM